MNNGLDPYCFGPPAWHFLHSVAMGYPEINEDQTIANQYKSFYESLQFVLPCEWCKEHYLQNLKTLPIDDYLDTRLNLALWVYKMHNLVNDITNKSNRPSFEEVYKKYDSYRAPCDEDAKVCGSSNSRKCNIIITDLYQNWPLIIFSLILVVIIATVIYKISGKR